MEMKRTSLGDNIQGREVLLPARAGYVGLTLLVALLFELAPLPRWVAWAWPDFVALMLVYWGVHQPHRIGLLTAWAAGLLMDVAGGALLGQHALAYGVLMYGAIFLHRRIRMFPLRLQAAQFLLECVLLLQCRGLARLPVERLDLLLGVLQRLFRREHHVVGPLLQLLARLLKVAVVRLQRAVERGAQVTLRLGFQPCGDGSVG